MLTSNSEELAEKEEWKGGEPSANGLNCAHPSRGDSRLQREEDECRHTMPA
jgi:hypothetical protein